MLDGLGFFQIYSNVGSSAEYLPICKNKTYFNSWLILETIVSYHTSKELLFIEEKKKKERKAFKSRKDTLSFMPIHIWVYQNKASPKTGSLLNSNNILSLPSIFFIHPMIHSYQHLNTNAIMSMRTPSHSCGSSPCFTGSALGTSVHQPVATTGLPGRYLPLSLCRKRYIYLLPLRYDTHAAYLQEQSRFNKVTSKYARC